MKDTKKRRPFKTLAEDLRAVRRRPLTSEQVGRLNKIFEKDIEAENQRLSIDETGKKIAVSQDPEVEV